MFFKKWKSRKQLLKEIEELKAARTVYLDRWMDKCDSYNSIIKQIQTLKAVCIDNKSDIGEEIPLGVRDCLCKQLAKELFQYISIEKYAYAPTDPLFHGEIKYIATIKIVDD